MLDSNLNHLMQACFNGNKHTLTLLMIYYIWVIVLDIVIVYQQ